MFLCSNYRLSIRKLLPAAVLLLALAAQAAPGLDVAGGRAFALQPTLLPPDPGEVRLLAGQPPVPNEFMGQAVALDGDRLLAGASGAEPSSGQVDAGAAYIFERRSGQEWVQVARLEASDPQPQAGFGSAVALSGDTAAVGARYASTGNGPTAAGAVYVFERSRDGAWEEQARLAARDGGPFHLFGAALALQGDTLLVGAPGAGDLAAARHSGAAYVFQRQGKIWLEQARLTSEELQPYDYFGHALALAGNTAAVGAFGRDELPDGLNAGAVYLFQRREGAWYSQGRVAPPPGGDTPAADSVLQAGPQFGVSLALAGQGDQPGWLVVGANQHGARGLNLQYPERMVGEVYVFEQRRDAWELAGRLAPAQMPEYGFFGQAVAADLAGQAKLRVAVSGSYAQQVWVFEGQAGSWAEVTPRGPSEFGGLQFGEALALQGSTLVVGAPWNHTTRPPDEWMMTGAVYVYNLGGAGEN